MKICLINDTHMGARNDSHAINDYFFKFWDGVFFPYLEQNNIQTVVHLGDVVDRRKYVNYVTLNKWRNNFFNKLKKYDLHLLVGNHDVPYYNTNEINALDELFRSFGKIYSEPQDVIFDGTPIAMIPWINASNQAQTLKYIKNTKAQIAFGHLELEGFEMDRGNVMMKGLSRNVFKKFDMVLSGHYHHKSSDGHIFYLGNQYEMTWIDYDDERGFHVFDTETRDLEFIPNPYKLHHKVIYDDKKDFDFETLKTIDLSKYTGAYVKVIVVNKSNPFLFDSFIDQLAKANPIDYSVVEDFSEVLDGSEDEIDQAQDTMTILENHINSINLDDMDINKDLLKSTLREIYVEASNLELA